MTIQAMITIGLGLADSSQSSCLDKASQLVGVGSGIVAAKTLYPENFLRICKTSLDLPIRNKVTEFPMAMKVARY